jgi:hypothetical protein
MQVQRLIVGLVSAYSSLTFWFISELVLQWVVNLRSSYLSCNKLELLAGGLVNCGCGLVILIWELEFTLLACSVVCACGWRLVSASV